MISNVLLVCDGIIALALAAWLCCRVKPVWKAVLIFAGCWAAVCLTEGLLQWGIHLFGFNLNSIWQNFVCRFPSLLILALVIDRFDRFRRYVGSQQAEKMLE